MSVWRKALWEYVSEITCKDTSGHDPFHPMRTYGLAKYIIAHEPLEVDGDKVYAIAIPHDIGWTRYSNPAVLKEDPKGEKHPEYSAQMIEPVLKRIGFPESKIEDVLKGIRLHDDTKHWGNNVRNVENEIKVVQDADNLEAMGAIGLTRLIIYGYGHGKMVYKPKGTHEDCTIHNIEWHIHILEKRLHTRTAKELAKRLQSFQKQFVQNFLGQHSFAMRCAEE